jgi:uncharacterized membrane protein
MELSPEERHKIYEEEKARIEAEQRQSADSGDSTTGLKPNVAGLLCYLGGWITGIIFLVIEQKNRFVRFHAVQSIIVFGVLTIASAILSWIPFVGGFFGAVIGILFFISWIVLMVKAYQGELYKIPGAGGIAESIIPVSDVAVGEKPVEAEVKTAETTAPPPEMPTPSITTHVKIIEHKLDRYFTNSKAARVTSSSFAIAWSIILLIFFSFFNDYIAFYESETVGGITTWIRLPLLTQEYHAWLPILITTLLLSIAGHIILIIHDRYWLRETILIILNVLGVVTVATLVSIFPFDFYVIPSNTVADIVAVSVRIALIAIAVGLGIGSLVMFIKLIINLLKSTSESTPS